MSLKAKHSELKLEDVGGKAFNLIQLSDAGFNVPEFTVVPKDVLSIHLQETNLKNADEVNQKINGLDIDNIIKELVDEAFDQPQDKSFAVRSSAVQEDGSSHSFAGQFESYLYVNYADIASYVKKVWLSNFSDRVKS